MTHRIRNPLPALLALTAALAVPPAFAQATPPPQDPPPTTGADAMQAAPAAARVTPAFAEFDVDSDGRISQAEVAIDSQLSRDFAARDKNRDGALSEVEYHTDAVKHEAGKRK